MNKECVYCVELDILNYNDKINERIKDLWKGTDIKLKVLCSDCNTKKDIYLDVISFGDNEHLVEVFNED